jgi:ATPase subunit of ABC transporter with duplicated ATPase domains
MRLALAQVLFVPSDLLLLDEPTNHLDLHAVLWLKDYLLNPNLTMIIVSHDRDFLNICTDIMHFENAKLKYYVGNYSEFERQQEERSARNVQILDAADRQRAKAMAFVEKQESMANKKKHDPNKLKQAKMIKKKKLDRIGNYREDGKRYKNFSLKKLDASYIRHSQKVEIEVNEPVLKFKFPIPAPLGGALVTLDDCYFGYDPSLDPILNNVTLDLNLESKVALVGRNGSGKSTLLKIITGQLHPDKGEIRRHAKLRIGHVTQHHIETLNTHAALTPIEYIENCLRESISSDVANTTTGIRSQLGAFGLGGKHATRRIGSLSGGEKMRLCFATVMTQKPHLFILDEPTNHLDIETLDSLASALDQFKGAILIVSHNQGFLCGFCNELWVVENKKVNVKYSDSSSFTDNFSLYKSTAIQNRSSTRQTKANIAKRATVQRSGLKQTGGFIT